MLFHQLREHLVKSIVGVGDFLTGPNIAEVDDFDVVPVVEELVEGFADMVGTVGAASVIDAAAFFLDTYQGELEAFQLGEILLVTKDGEGLPEGFLSGSAVIRETFLWNRFQKQ